MAVGPNIQKRLDGFFAVVDGQYSEEAGSAELF